jgi:hypothetical protein
MARFSKTDLLAKSQPRAWDATLALFHFAQGRALSRETAANFIPRFDNLPEGGGRMRRRQFITLLGGDGRDGRSPLSILDRATGNADRRHRREETHG